MCIHISFHASVAENSPVYFTFQGSETTSKIVFRWTIRYEIFKGLVVILKYWCIFIFLYFISVQLQAKGIRTGGDMKFPFWLVVALV